MKKYAFVILITWMVGCSDGADSAVYECEPGEFICDDNMLLECDESGEFVFYMDCDEISTTYQRFNCALEPYYSCVSIQ